MGAAPAGPLLPTAHDVLPEYSFISGLYGTGVPGLVLARENSTVGGRPSWVRMPCARHPEERRRVSEEAIEALAASCQSGFAPRGGLEDPHSGRMAWYRSWDACRSTWNIQESIGGDPCLLPIRPRGTCRGATVGHVRRRWNRNAERERSTINRQGCKRRRRDPAGSSPRGYRHEA